MSYSVGPRERPVLAGLICFGVLAIVLGWLNLRRAISGPPRVPSANMAPPIALSREESDQQRRAQLAAQDTDRDGLTDLDEFERTKTSPFLTDSDSDGRSDAEEVAAGEDPNCPRGTVCASGGADAIVRPNASAVILPGVPTQPPGVAGASGLTSRASTPNPSELRAMLVQQGLPASAIAALSDEELVRAYAASLESFTRSADGGTNPIAAAIAQAFAGGVNAETTDRAAILRALPTAAPEIRQFLEQGGFPRDQLQRLDDAELLTLWQQTVKELEREVQDTEP